jgi:hypothetical protein
MQQPGRHWEVLGWENVCQAEAAGRKYSCKGSHNHPVRGLPYMNTALKLQVMRVGHLLIYLIALCAAHADGGGCYSPVCSWQGQFQEAWNWHVGLLC